MIMNGRIATPTHRGFTLVEIMIAMAVGLAILGLMYEVFDTQQRSLSAQEQIVDMQRRARLAMDLLSREIRMAGYDPRQTQGFGFIAEDVATGRGTNANGVYFTRDADTDGVVDNNDEERVAFRLDGMTLQYYNVAAGAWRNVMTDVESLTFAYTLKDGSVVVNPTGAQINSIASVQVTLVVRAAKPDPAYVDPSQGDHYRRYRLCQQVTARNLRYRI